MITDISLESNALLKVDSYYSLQSLHSSDASNNETVKKIISRRIEQIQVNVTFFLDRMIENARIISFGIR